MHFSNYPKGANKQIKTTTKTATEKKETKKDINNSKVEKNK